MGCGSSSTPPTQPTPAPQEPVPLYSPPEDFPTPRVLAECQRDLAQIDTSDAQGVDKDGFPLPFPSKRWKVDFFDRNKLSPVREHALKAPTDLALQPLAHLVEYLKDGANTDLERLYAAFAWLVYTSQNLHKHRLEPTPAKDTTLYRLVLAHAGNVRYNTIFSDICKEVGLTVRTIQGKVKVIDDILATSEDSDWLAVLLDTSWRLIDVDFAVMSIKNQQLKKDERHLRESQPLILDLPFYRNSEFYFLTDPEQFIFSHFAQDIAWQILARPVSYEEFKTMSHLKEGFFYMGFLNVQEGKGILESDDGHVDLKLSLAEDNLIRLSSSLEKIVGKSVQQVIKGKNLNDFVEITNNGHDKNIQITLIDIGRFMLKLWAEDINPENSTIYQCNDVIGVWFFDCKKPSFVWENNPKNGQSEFGPGADLKALGISLEDIPITQGMKHILVRCNQDMHEFGYTLEANHSSQSHLKQFLLHYNVPTVGSGVIIKFPTLGKFVLNIFVKDQHSGKHFKCVCTLLLHATLTHMDYSPFTKGLNTKVGHMVDSPTDIVLSPSSVDLRPVSHTVPYIESSNGQPISMAFESTKVCKFMFQYKVQTLSAIQDVRNYLWYNSVQQEDEKIRTELIVRLPQAGMYTLSLFACVAGTKTDTLREVYKYVISAQENEKDCLPFPEILQDWQPQCILRYPLNGILKEQEEVDFSIGVTGTQEVNVLHDRSSLYQTLQPAGDMFYSGSIKTLNGENHLVLTAKLQNKDAQLLKYTVMKSDDWLSLKEDQAKAGEAANQRQKQMMQLAEEEEARALQVKQKTAETEMELSEKFEAEKEDLIEREKNWQKEFEEYFGKQAEDMADQGKKELSEVEEVRVVKREIQIILQTQMFETELRKKLYKGMTEDLLRQRLRRAIKSRDRNDLQRAVDDYYNSRLSTRGIQEVFVAERLLEIIRLRDDLIHSTSRKDVQKTAELLEEIRKKNYEDDMAQEVSEAEKMILNMQKMNGFKDYILKMDKRMMSELRSYQKPPDGVHHVMKAVFLILGDDEATTAEWSSCASMCNPYGMEGLNRRIIGLDINCLHPEIVARAKQLLGEIPFKKVQWVSSGAALFFMWAKSCIEEYESTGEEDSGSFLDHVKPAKSVDRQKKLLGNLPLQLSLPLHGASGNRGPVLRTGNSLEVMSSQNSTRSSASLGQVLVSSDVPVKSKQGYKSSYGFVKESDSSQNSEDGSDLDEEETRT